MANIQINPAQSALQNLVALIDSLNPSAPTSASQITTSNLTAVTVGSISGDATANTSVQVNAVNGSKFQGSVTIYYARETLSDQITSVGGTVSLPVSATTPALQLAAVASHFGFIPSEISWVSNPVKPSGGGAGTGTIQCSGSVVYVDAQATVNLNWAVGNTALLMHFEGTNGSQTMTDDAGNVMTVKDAVLSTSQAMFGTSSWFWNNITDANVSTVDSAQLEFGAGQDMTIEFWAYPLNNTQNGVIFCKSTGSVSFLDYSNSGQFSFNTDQTANALAMNNSLTVGAWNHVAFVKKSGVWTVYVNGVVGATTSSHTSDTFGVNNQPFIIGNFRANGNPFQGYLDEFRVSRVARYSSAFTPPTAAFVLD